MCSVLQVQPRSPASAQATCWPPQPGSRKRAAAKPAARQGVLSCFNLTSYSLFKLIYLSTFGCAGSSLLFRFLSLGRAGLLSGCARRLLTAGFAGYGARSRARGSGVGEHGLRARGAWARGSGVRAWVLGFGAQQSGRLGSGLRAWALRLGGRSAWTRGLRGQGARAASLSGMRDPPRPDQSSNPCLLHGRADSPLGHQGSPSLRRAPAWALSARA